MNYVYKHDGIRPLCKQRYVTSLTVFDFKFANCLSMTRVWSYDELFDVLSLNTKSCCSLKLILIVLHTVEDFKFISSFVMLFTLE